MEIDKSWLRIEIVVDWKLFLSIALSAWIIHLLPWCSFIQDASAVPVPAYVSVHRLEWGCKRVVGEDSGLNAIVHARFNDALTLRGLHVQGDLAGERGVGAATVHEEGAVEEAGV